MKLTTNYQVVVSMTELL